MNKEDLIQLWLDAEEENRKHTEEGINKCLQLKDKFSNEFGKLTLDDKQYVTDYLDSVGG